MGRQGGNAVHAVVFQFRPHPEHRETYLALVAELRPELERIPGFLANERFHVDGDPLSLVSISLWEDEAAIQRWRAHAGHRVAQRRGKLEVFASYRLRVGEAVAASEPHHLRLAIGRALAPAEGAESFAGLLEPARRLVLGPWVPGPTPERAHALRILRDYGPAAPRPFR
jgi:heme-degrading monooxygenase HmoA